jgi:hypothetical protein
MTPKPDKLALGKMLALERSPTPARKAQQRFATT